MDSRAEILYYNTEAPSTEHYFKRIYNVTLKYYVNWDSVKWEHMLNNYVMHWPER